MTRLFDELTKLRPTMDVAVNLVLFTLDANAQTQARKAARRAVDKHGNDGEITVYNGFRYRVSAKYALRALTEWRSQRGWTSAGSLWVEAAKVAAAEETARKEMARRAAAKADEAFAKMAAEASLVMDPARDGGLRKIMLENRMARPR